MRARPDAGAPARSGRGPGVWRRAIGGPAPASVQRQQRRVDCSCPLQKSSWPSLIPACDTKRPQAFTGSAGASGPRASSSPDPSAAINLAPATFRVPGWPPRLAQTTYGASASASSRAAFHRPGSARDTTSRSSSPTTATSKSRCASCGRTSTRRSAPQPSLQPRLIRLRVSTVRPSPGDWRVVDVPRASAHQERPRLGVRLDDTGRRGRVVPP
jgi:hypothetical protein